MKDILTAFAVVAILLVTIFFVVKISDMAQDIRIVIPKPGIECAVATRLATVGIDCWQKEKPKGDNLYFKDGREYIPKTPTLPDTVYIEGVYNQPPPDIAGGPNRAAIEDSIGKGEELLIIEPKIDHYLDRGQVVSMPIVIYPTHRNIGEGER